MNFAHSLLNKVLT